VTRTLPTIRSATPSTGRHLPTWELTGPGTSAQLRAEVISRPVIGRALSTMCRSSARTRERGERVADLLVSTHGKRATAPVAGPKSVDVQHGGPVPLGVRRWRSRGSHRLGGSLGDRRGRPDN
jgi:hypothetical protein